MKITPRFWRLTLLLAGFVVFPAILIFIFGRAKWVHQTLPYYDLEGTTTKVTPNTHTVTDEITFTDHHGKSFRLKDLDSFPIVLVNIFFASCPEVCPEMNKQIQSVAEKIYKTKDENRIAFLTISIDPERDSVPALADYAKTFKADNFHRIFARTDNKAALYEWVKRDLFLAADQESKDFIHDDKVVILDKDRHVRSILQTRGKSNVERLGKIKSIEADIDNLIYEYRQQKIESKK